MAVNKYLPHLLIIPEDDANRQIANGFLLEASVKSARIQVLEETGGWHNVVSTFLTNHVSQMVAYPQRYILLVLDFDDEENRMVRIKTQLPAEFSERVFIIGTLSEPERLRPDLGSFENIGLSLARDCLNNTTFAWGHNLLAHNADELARLNAQIRPFIF